MKTTELKPGDMVRYGKAMVTHLGWTPDRMRDVATVMVVHNGYVAAQWSDGSITHLAGWQIVRA